MNRIQQPTKEIPGIEILRFCAALTILVFHYIHFTYRGVALSQNLSGLNLPFYNFLWVFYEFGKYAIQIFWSISGFIFFLKYKNIIANKIIRAKTFFILRFSRLYPLHLLTLLLVFFLQTIYLNQTGFYFVNQYNDLPHFILQLFLATDWEILRGTGFNVPIWSVSVEVITYFIFFVLIRSMGRSIYINFIIIFITLILNAIGFKSSILGCIKYFYAGGLAAFAYESRHEVKKIDSLMLLICASFPLIILIAHIMDIKIKSYVFFILIYTPILIYLLASKIKLSAKANKLSRSLGNLTYASYLIHFPVQICFMIYFNTRNKSTPYQDSYFFIFYLTIVLILSWLLYKFYEKPSQNYIRKIFNQNSF